jgi:hypothetical protein
MTHAAHAAPSVPVFQDMWFAWTQLRQLPDNLICKLCPTNVRKSRLLQIVSTNAPFSFYLQMFLGDGKFFYTVAQHLFAPDPPPTIARETGL